MDGCPGITAEVIRRWAFLNAYIHAVVTGEPRSLKAAKEQ